MRSTATWMTFQDIISDAQIRIRDIAGQEVGQEVLQHWVSEANREFARKSESVHGEYRTVLTPEVAEYRLPSDSLRPDRVEILFPGFQNHRLLTPMTEKEHVHVEHDVQSSGVPSHWYWNAERTHIGLWPKPSAGGKQVLTTDNAGDALTIISTNLSTTDDIYNGLEVKVLGGDAENEQQTISDYVGSTGTITVDAAFSTPILTGIPIAVHPDSVKINYIRAGNFYRITPATETVKPASLDQENLKFTVNNLGDRPIDYFVGCEVYFKDGDCAGEKTRVVASYGNGTTLNAQLWPRLHTMPAAADAVVFTDVPNIPDAYHSALVDHVVYQWLQRQGDKRGRHHLDRFMELVQDAGNRDSPATGQVFHRVRETRHSEGRDRI